MRVVRLALPRVVLLVLTGFLCLHVVRHARAGVVGRAARAEAASGAGTTVGEPTGAGREGKAARRKRAGETRHSSGDGTARSGHGQRRGRRALRSTWSPERH